MCILFRAPALKLTTARLKLLLISGVSSVCRVTGPHVNKGLFAGSAGIASVLSTFIRTSSFQSLVLHAPLAFDPFYSQWISFSITRGGKNFQPCVKATG